MYIHMILLFMFTDMKTNVYIYIRHRALAREREQCLSWGFSFSFQGSGLRAGCLDSGLSFWLFFRDTQRPAQLWFEAFFSLNKPSFLQCPRKPLFCAFVPKWPKSDRKGIQNPSQNGVKWAPKSTFSATCPKSHFLDSTWGITTFPPSWVDPFSPFVRLFSCRKGGCELVPQQITQNSLFFWPRCKIVQKGLTPPFPGGSN